MQNGNDDDPCDDWSRVPIPKPSSDKPERPTKRRAWGL